MFKRELKQELQQPPKPKFGSLRAEVNWDLQYKWTGHVYVYTGRNDYKDGWELFLWWAERTMQYINVPRTVIVDFSSKESAERNICKRLDAAIKYMENPQLRPKGSILYPGDCA